jgi:hypothetical protein
LKGVGYEESCKEAGLETLEERRKAQDMAKVFKIVKSLDKSDPGKIFPARRPNLNTWQSANPWNLTSNQAKTDLRKSTALVLKSLKRGTDYMTMLRVRGDYPHSNPI